MSEIEIPELKEIRYTVHDENMFLVAIDASDRPFLFYSMSLGHMEGRSLSRKARKVYEYSSGRRLAGKVKSKSVRPEEFFKSYGAMFSSRRPSEL